MLQLLFFVCFIIINIDNTYGSLCITKIIVRVPKEHDIGLIFDLTVKNNIEEGKKEMLQYVISTDGTCTLNNTKGEQIKNAGRIFGGDFGAIEGGKVETVSLIWPTVSLYNRVGFCPILIKATNVKEVMGSTKQLLHFDTRFETLDPESHNLRKHKNFKDCKNWDKNYFSNCTPLNCEERYFGQRSFWNYQTEQCEPVTPCSASNTYYDMYANECLDRDSFITDEELEQIKQGKFDDNFLELRAPETAKQFQANTNEHTQKIFKKNFTQKSARRSVLSDEQCAAGAKISLSDFNKCFQHLIEDEVPLDTTLVKKQEKKSILSNFYYDWFLPLRSDSSEAVDTSNAENNGKSKSWSLFWQIRPQTAGERMIRLANILLIIFLVIMFQVAITLGTYLFFSFSIYWFLELVAYVKSNETANELAEKLTPRRGEHSIITKKSLMTHR